MATPNYSYEKRQRELAKKRKAEEKRQRKNNPRPDGVGDNANQADGNDSVGTVQPSSPAPN